MVPGSACCRDPCSATAWGSANLLLLIAAALLQLSLWWWVFLRGFIYFSHKREAVVCITDPPGDQSDSSAQVDFCFSSLHRSLCANRYPHTDELSINTCIHVYIHIYTHMHSLAFSTTHPSPVVIRCRPCHHPLLSTLQARAEGLGVTGLTHSTFTEFIPGLGSRGPIQTHRHTTTISWE